jgi:amino acid adenylation domain-containing protein
LVELGRYRAFSSPDKVAYTFLKDGEVEEANLSYAELDLRSRALAAELQARGLGGERILMLYPSGLDFVVGFLGCLYAGALAVPAYMPQQRREHWQRLESIVADCDARLILGSEASLASLREPLAESETLREIPTLASDLVDAALAERWVDPAIDSAYIAFLQYTSGSTGSPKGVMVSHGNLLHNQWLMREAFGHHQDSVLVSWLPLFHDMGLIGNVLHTLYLGARCVLMSPVAFLQSPVRWLKAISTYRGHSSFAPNFAYELCVRRVGEEQRAELDLSSWTFALNGAEPVRAETLRKFSEAFAGCGFAANACYPGYGLAECTLFAAGGTRFGGWIERKVDAAALSVGRAEAAAGDASALVAVSSGRQWHDLDIRIVDPDTGIVCADGAVGEIWLSGPSVAQGYWRKPEATEATFRARIVGDSTQAWLRTGDLGFSSDGAVFITGRLKEVVIVRGRNYYPQDIEHTVQQAVQGLRPDGGAAFSVDLDGDEQLVVVQEVERTAMRGFDTDAAAQAVRAAIAEVHEIPLRAVVFIRPATLPKTSSGKIQRRECRQRFVTGALTEIGRGEWLVRESALSASAFDGEALRALPQQERCTAVLSDIRGWLSARLGVAEAAIDSQAPLLGLGIDSVRIVEFQHLLEERLSVEIALTELLQTASLQALATALSERVGAGAAGSERSTREAAQFDQQTEGDALEEPSLNQRALWLQHQLSRGSGAYTIALPLRIRQRLDEPLLSRAIDAVVARHEQLRTVFADVEGAPRMRVQVSNLEILRTIDASGDSDAALRTRVAASAHRDLDVEHGPIFVAELYRRDEESVLLLKAHHLVVDLWSMQLLLREIVDTYTALSAVAGDLDALPAPGDYRRYAAWQRAWLRSPAAAEAEGYWRMRLAALPPPLALSNARRPAAHTHAGAALDVMVPPACRDALAALGHRAGATLYSVLLAAYQVLLCRYSGEDAVCVGTPVADRERSDFGASIGYFVNPLPLIGAIDDNPAFDTHLARTRDAVFAALAHRHYPLVRMIEAVGAARDHAVSPLFQTLFAYQSTHILEGFAPFVLGAEGGRLSRGALTLDTYPLPVQRALMDLSLTVVDTEHGLASRFEYNTDLFDAATVARLAEAWLTLLQAVVANPSTPVWQLDAVGASERRRIAAYHRTERDFAESNLRAEAPDDAGLDAASAACDARDYLPQIVARQVQRTPNAIALIDGEIALSYAQFQRRVDRLSLRLQAAGIGSECRVVVAMPRSAEMVIALHAVMSAGAAYVPVDPQLPAIRIGHIFDSAQPRLSIVAADSAVALPSDAACLRLDPALWAGIDDDTSSSQMRPAPAALRDDSAAYVIYTSGSTGLPKGVINTHAGIRNRLLWMQAAYPLGADDRVVQKTPFGFDVSVWEFFWPLMFGAGLVVAKPEGHRDPAYLHALFAEHRVTTAHFVPSMLGQFLDHALVPPAAAGDAPALPSLRRVICSGEELPLAMQRDFFRRYPGVELHNLYGPTEAAVDVSAWACLPEQSSGPVPIGWPIANTRLYVLDRMLQPVATGVPGELFIAGVNLARGYAARPDLTADRFLPDPFGPAGSRMYRTGDLARLREDGAIEYLGRTDFQIKLRGLRIELGEIESAILGQGLAREAVVVAREFGADRRLVAYIAGGEAKVYAQQPARFAEALRARLPDYMVPAHVVALDALPLSANGKIDRNALPAPALLDEHDAWQAPQGAVESVLAGVWAELLDHPRIGRDSHFFALGGHSLLAMRLGAQVRARFGVELGLAHVFAAPTLREQAAAIELRIASGVATAAVSAPLAPRPVIEGEAMPLSRAQQRLWLLERLDPGNPVYNVPIAIDLHGPTDAAALNAALRAICAEHTVLRSVFFDNDGVGMQRCMPVPTSPLTTADLRALPASEREARLAAAVEAAATRGFDLGVSAFRAELLIADDTHAVLVLNLHHIVSDGRSVELLLDALWAHYRAIMASGERASDAMDTAADRASGTATTAAPRWQYADYAYWDASARDTQVSARQLAFWAERLAGLEPLSTLPTDRPRPPLRRFQGASLPFALSSALSAQIVMQCRRCGVTPGTFLLAAFQYVLARHAGKCDIAVGMPVSTRDREQWQPLLGFFVNTLAIRSRFGETDTFSALLGRVADDLAQALAHQDVFFDEVVEHLQPERSPGHNPLVQVMFSYQDAPPADWREGALRWQRRAYDSRVAKFDLTAVLESGAEGIGGYVEYDTELYDAATIAAVMAHYRELLAVLAESVERPLADLPWLSKPEQARLLAHFDRSATEYPALSVHALFAQCALRHADAPALRADGVDWTYAELERRANAAAAGLRQRGVGPGSRVAVCMTRTPAMIVSLLAVLKNGAAYVPIDPQLPIARTQAILRDAGIAHLIGATSLLRALTKDSAFALAHAIDGEALAEASLCETALSSDINALPWCDAQTPADAPAYVIYTSGSTGVPKGVVVPHRGIARLLFGVGQYGLGPQRRILHAASIAFDASTFEVWGALLHGGVCVLSSEAVPTPAGLRRAIAEDGVDTLWLTSSLFNVIAETDAACFGGLSQLLVGGDRVSPRHVALAQAAAPGLVVINGYGPTETTTFACCHRIASPVDVARELPIGTPLGNTALYVLDAGLQWVPAGVAGELYIGGAGLAQGYLGAPEATAAAFVPDPFSSTPGARMYRTGDLVRHLADGTLEFLGRRDHQVKIRGFRIELAEIEARLQASPQLRDAAVKVQGDGADKRLVAYAVAETPDCDPAEVLATLRASLPDYMVPARLLLLDLFPLNANGKLDRAALPDVAFESDAHHYVAPRDALESRLAELWQDALGVARVGIYDDFFALGGHSLMAMKVAAAWGRFDERELPVRALFEHPTVAALAARLREHADARAPARKPTPVARSKYAALSFSQQRLWFLEQMEGPSPLYSMTSALRIEGDLDLDLFERALNKLVERHESLRTRFVLVDELPAQEVLERAELRVGRIDYAALDASVAENLVQRVIATEAATPFDLGQAPLMRATAIRTGAQSHVLLFNMHHIVSDGWSVDVLIRELSQLYSAGAASRDEAAALAPLPLQYVDFACWQRELLQTGHYDSQLDYWRARLADAPPLLELPTDRPRPAMQDPRGERLPLQLPPTLTAAVRRLARENGASVFMTLLAAYSALLARHSGQSDIAVGAPIANRTHPEFAGLIGFFANTIVLRAQVNADSSFRDLLHATREYVTQAQSHQDVPFEQLVEDLNPVRSPSHSPLFQAMFAYENVTQARWRLGELAVEPVDVDTGYVKFDVLLSLRDDGERIVGAMEYRSALFERSTVQRWCGHLLSLLAAAAADPDRPLRLHPLLGEDERLDVLERLNRTAPVQTPALCVHELFERQAQRTPDATAVLYGTQAWTYRALHARAEAIAAMLRRSGAGRGTRVAVYLERHPDLVATLLATMKAGAAYVPLDPKYPAARNADIIADTAPAVIATQRSLSAEVADRAAAVGARLLEIDLAIDSDASAEVANQASDAAPATLNDPAYFIYTSGSTGRPKGIVISHRSAATMLAWADREFDADELAVTLASTSICFDISIFELFLPLAKGCALLLVNDALALAQAPLRDRVTLINTVPSAMTALLETSEPPSALRTVNLAGEPLTRRLADAVYAHTTARKLYNLYGPSEDTTYSTWSLVPRDSAEKPTIGRPIANTQAYVLDAFGQPAPLGIAGELYLAGDGLADGYWNRPELTAAAFVANPFDPAPGARMYRTGDWVRMRANGELEYIGRIDHQVKLNGFRIELGEIEHRMLRCPGVAMACVLVRKDQAGFDRLVGYVSSEGGETAADTVAMTDTIRRELERQLPHFMVPSAIVGLQRMPLSPNGKIDRRALPEPPAWGSEQAEYRAPRTETERRVAAIWADLLQRPRIGLDDNFFDIGGHSLLAAQISLRVKREFEVELPVRHVFQSATVAALAEEIDNRRWLQRSASSQQPADAFEEGTI